MADDITIPATPTDALQRQEAPKKYIRTYARDMATVQKGGTPDLVPLSTPTSPATGSTASGVPEVPPRSADLETSSLNAQSLSPAPALPTQASAPAATPVKSEPTPPQAPPHEVPKEAVVTTYDKGFKEAAKRTEAQVATSPAGVAWQAEQSEREAILARLEEQVRTQTPLPPRSADRGTSSLDARSLPQPPPPRHIETAPLPARAIAPPASALSVPAYATDLAMGVPGESVPEPLLPPEPIAMPIPQAASAFTLAPEEFITKSQPPPPPVPEPFVPAQQHVPVPTAPTAPVTDASLHTYTTDFSDQVRTNEASAAAILAAEADARRTALPARETRPSRKRMYIAIGCIILGAGALFGAYARFVINTSPVQLAFGPTAPIFVDEQEVMRGEGRDLLLAFEGVVGRPLGNGQVRLLYNPSATSTTLFNALGFNAPSALLRNITPGGSMAGVIAAGGDQTPFFILSVTSYGDTFAGMLAWEPRMLSQLAPLYPPHSDQSSLVEVSSTTPVVAPPARQEGFSDDVVANHDVRVYRDSLGRSVLIYGYWNQSTLVIARDEAAFNAILSRLASARSI